MAGAHSKAINLGGITQIPSVNDVLQALNKFFIKSIINRFKSLEIHLGIPTFQIMLFAMMRKA